MIGTFFFVLCLKKYLYRVTSLRDTKEKKKKPL